MKKRDALKIEFPLPIRTERLEMSLAMPEDGELVNAGVLESWDVLSQWMKWAKALPSVEDTRKAMRDAYEGFQLGQEFSCKILHRGEFVGMCGLHTINWEQGSAHIGYWVRKSKQGQGFITEAVHAITIYGLRELKLKRMELLCDDANVRSAAVAERLGFKFERKGLGLVDPLPNVPGERVGRIYVCSDIKQLPQWKVSW